MRKETLKKHGRTYYLRSFDDWLDFLACAERVERGRRGNKFGGMNCASLTSGKRDWYGTSSLAEAIRLARQGWPEGRSRVREVRQRLQIDHLLPHAQRITRQTDVAGDEPDIDLFLRGEPENMVTLYERNLFQHGKVLRFILNRTARYTVPSSSIVRRGVGLLAAFETLIVLGYTVDVTVMDAADANGSSRYELSIPVLHAGDPINLDTLAFMFLHPAVLRRLVFAAEECETRRIREEFGFEDGHGYGRPCDPHVLQEHDVLLKWKEGLLTSDRQILPFTMEILKRVGISVSEVEAA